jgi:AAA domain
MSQFNGRTPATVNEVDNRTPQGPLTIASLQEQVAAEAKQTAQQQPVGPSEPERKLITAADLLSRRVESIPCLVEPVLQAVGLAAVAGSSDVGKSAFLRQLAFAVATGQPNFLGWPIRAKHRAAIYVSSEDDENATAFLLNSLNKIKRHDEADCHRLRFIFETHDLLNELDYHLYSGDANKTNQIRQFLHDYSQLAQKHGCLILWLHHTGKRTDEEAPSKHHVIGGQGFEGKMRLLIELRRDHHDPTTRHLCIVKGNYLPDDYKNDSYVLRFTDFVFEQTGERTSFEQLAKPKTVEDEGAKYKRAVELQHEGYTLEQIAQELGYSNKGGVSKLLKRNARDAPVSSQFPGNPQETSPYI